jgi:hypothetical protein
LQADRGKALNPDTDLDDTMTRGLPPGQELQADRGKALNPDTDVDDIVTGGLLPPGQELQADRGRALKPDTDVDDIVTRAKPPGLELNLDRGEPLPPGWQTKVAPGTIAPDTDESPETAIPAAKEVDNDRAKMLPSTNPELNNDDEANVGWKLVPFFGAVLFFLWREFSRARA